MTTVRELIRLLNDLPPDTEVFVPFSDGPAAVNSVTLRTADQAASDQAARVGADLSVGNWFVLIDSGEPNHWRRQHGFGFQTASARRWL